MVDNPLNIYRNVQVLKAKTADDLANQIRSILTEVKILSIYPANGQHIAWVLADIKAVARQPKTEIAKKTQTQRVRRKKNGSSKR